jgi:hypothetical protein
MIPFALDLSQVRASSLSSRLERACDSVTSQVEMRAPERVVTSNPDPVAEWTDLGSESGASVSTLRLPLPDLSWTPANEKRFLDLAGREATGQLTPQGAGELERLSQMRRGLKNPRRGEELLWDYEQRELTRNLISALSRYVTFHNPPNRSSSAET